MDGGVPCLFTSEEYQLDWAGVGHEACRRRVRTIIDNDDDDQCSVFSFGVDLSCA